MTKPLKITKKGRIYLLLGNVYDMIQQGDDDLALELLSEAIDLLKTLKVTEESNALVD